MILLYYELLEVVIQTPSLDLLRKHQDLLNEIDPDKVLVKYGTEILKASEMISNFDSSIISTSKE